MTPGSRPGSTLLARLIEDAVQDAITPSTGICLSGGIDSSTVTSLAPHWLPVFTGWYDHPGCDERHYAELVTGGREWHEVQITPDDFVECAEDTLAALDGLRCGPGAVGQFVVCRYASEHVTHLLTGEGGDELFGGYARQYLVAGLAPPDGFEDYELPDGYPTTLEAALEFEWGGLKNLCAVDKRIGEWHGLQITPPMLNPWVVAYAVRLPAGMRIAKRHLREAMRGVVPKRILERTDKKGFPVPYVAWAQEDPVRGFLEERIGYVPDPGQPWSRQWWYDLQDTM